MARHILLTHRRNHHHHLLIVRLGIRGGREEAEAEFRPVGPLLSRLVPQLEKLIADVTVVGTGVMPLRSILAAEVARVANLEPLWEIVAHVCGCAPRTLLLGRQHETEQDCWLPTTFAIVIYTCT